MQTTSATIIIADDHPLFRGALKQALAFGGPETAIVEAGSLEEARKAAEAHPTPT